MDLLKTFAAFIGCSLDHYFSLFMGVLTVIFVTYRKRLYVVWKTLPRDLMFIYRLLNVGICSLMWMIRKETIITLFNKQVKKHPTKVVLNFEDKQWTAKELDIYSNKIGRIFQEAGYEKGDVVSLVSYNRMEYIGIWLGLAKIGVITSLINTNLRSDSLAHCIKTSKSKGLIYMSDFEQDVKDIRSKLPSELEYFTFEKDSDSENTKRLDKIMEETSGEKVVPRDQITMRDKVLYIYTSGTTGLPKAAVVIQSRLGLIGCLAKHMLNITDKDVIYNPLPLYHTAGGLIGVVPLMLFGVQTVIRKKFSATAYFPDCVKYKCTIAQYIGEICRYVLTTSPADSDTKHNLRLMLGNGMRPDVWKKFVERFKVPLVVELYGSTEGNTNLVNIDGKLGAVGFLPRILPLSILPIALIKLDETTGQPIRNEKGLCIRCDVDEPGMCIGLIKKDPVRNFEGYADKNETNKKIIHNVFKRGDTAFLSGDILVMDDYGYFYFKDRTGDTFRWKGENVSTGEVEILVSSLIGYKDCAVYGVEVGNLEGKAGMLSVVDPSNEIDLDSLAKGLDKHLPVYARPLFLRIMQDIQLTGTFKIKKVDLQKESFNPNVIKDKLYFKNGNKGFVPLTNEIYNDILNGLIKV